jgi:hypothetical protein
MPPKACPVEPAAGARNAAEPLHVPAERLADQTNPNYRRWKYWLSRIMARFWELKGKRQTKNTGFGYCEWIR